MNHKRGKPKHQRRGCLSCKPHKDERVRKTAPASAERRLQETPEEALDRDLDIWDLMAMDDYCSDPLCFCCGGGGPDEPRVEGEQLTATLEERMRAR